LASKHINHKIDVDFVSKFGGTYNGNPEPGNGYSNCSNIYCHSNGTSVSTAVNPVNSTLDWGTVGALACNGCHEYPPAYQNGTLKANSHSIHSSYGCATCHFGTTADGASISSFDKHVNKIYDLQPGPGVFFSYTFASGGGTCTNISCHGNNNAVWGATNLRCGNCHSISLGD
jgi:predicted CxxxxCH...CXXCH cytochrome family protein